MDVFKAWPGRAESIVISQESYMGCTGGVAPWRRDGDTGPSYYAVCPLCDNPIQIVGLFRRQEESRARRPYGRHHRGDVPGLCRYDEDAYLHCPYADPNHRTDTRARRHSKDPTGRALYGLMRGEFDRVTLAWERFSGIHLGPGAARDMLRRWRDDQGWRYYDATYGNLPQMLFFAAGGQNLVKRYIVPGSPLHERLKGVPQVRFTPARSRYVQVDKAGPGFLTLDFLLYARRIEWDGQHMNETFRLRGLLGRDDGQQAFDDLTLDGDQYWLSNTAAAQPGRDGRLLDIARETQQSDAGIPADQ